MKLKNQRLIALLLVVFLMLGAVGTQVFAWDAPTGEGATVGFEPEDIRIDNKTSSKTITLKGKFDHTLYDRLQNLALVLTISDPAAELDTAGTTYNPANGKISITGPSGLTDRVFTLNNITKTVTVTPSQNPDTTSNAIPTGGSAINKVSIGDKITFKTAKIIVQQPVVVRIIGTVPAGASVKTNLTKYATDDPGNTYNPAGTATALSDNDTFWVDTGDGAEDQPLLNITTANGYAAEFYTVDTPDNGAGTAVENVDSYETAGTSQTAGKIDKPKTVFVRFIKAFKLTFDPKGGEPLPATVVKYASDDDYTITEVVSKAGMKFLGWYDASGKKVTKWDTNSDLKVEAKFEALPVDKPSTFNITITAPDTLRTGESYKTATVTLAPTTVNQLGYPNAVLKVELIEKPSGSTPTLEAPILGNLIGLETPLTVTKDFSYTLPISEMMADKAGTYTVKVSLLDGANNNAVICTASHTLVASAYFITYELDGGTNPSNNPKGANSGEKISIDPPTKAGFTFTGWTSEDVTLTNGADPAKDPATFDMPTKDIVLKASFTAIGDGGDDSGDDNGNDDNNNNNNNNNNNPDNSANNGSGKPQTGDNSQLGLWITLLAISIVGIGGCVVYRFAYMKKKSSAQ